MDKIVAEARGRLADNLNGEVYRRCFGCLDLSSLDAADSTGRIEEMSLKAAEIGARFRDIPQVAAICVYPPFVETVGLAIGDSRIRIASVAGGFPSGQTFLEVKMLEAAMAVENGADEIDMVLNLGEFLTGNEEIAANEIEVIRSETGDDVTLKVIIESGMLTPEQTYRASVLAMLAGADFVKTSTGKNGVGATPEAAVVICRAIGDHYRRTGERVGFKAAGGVRTAEDAALYYTIVETVLGAEWLTPALFRIGASGAANALLAAAGTDGAQYF
ncbi:deoxyribose-phosphate aldolase [Alistipes sp. OttesenSCG-928-B03]|nr:deoxyribose-phosphate aldolase [Alistipes sp. OttesenSCG-928-B03]